MSQVLHSGRVQDVVLPYRITKKGVRTFKVFNDSGSIEKYYIFTGSTDMGKSPFLEGKSESEVLGILSNLGLIVIINHSSVDYNYLDLVSGGYPYKGVIL